MTRIVIVIAGLWAALLAGSVPASADEFLGSYMARISARDHRASDGFPLSSAAQMVRQDRANWHKFGSGDAEDQGETFFRSAASRARLEKLLLRAGAIDRSTQRAIMRGEPVVEVSVYRNSVEVTIVGY